MVSLKVVAGAVLSFLTIQSAALSIAGKPNRLIKPYKRAPLQDLVGAFSLKILGVLRADLNR